MGYVLCSLDRRPLSLFYWLHDEAMGHTFLLLKRLFKIRPPIYRILNTSPNIFIEISRRVVFALLWSLQTKGRQCSGYHPAAQS